MLRPRNLLLLGLCLQFAYTTLAAAQPRIISTDAAVTQILFTLGLDSDLVGVDVTSTLPADYREVPVIGYHRALSPEGILALTPTLVIGSEHIGPPIVLDALAAANIPVLLLPGAGNIGELKANIEKIAVSTGAVERTKEALVTLDRQSEELAEQPLQNDRVAFILALEPGKIRVAGTETSGDAFIKLLGAQNIADFQGYRTLSAEAILDLAPSIMLVAGHEGATPERLLKTNAILKYGQAAKAGNILPVNAANLVAGISPQAVADAVALSGSIKADTAQ